MNVSNRTGATGLFQQRPIFQKEYGIKDSRNPLEAVEGSARALASLQKRFGSIEEAVAAYNYGPGNVRRSGMNNLPEETRTYLDNVKKIMNGEEPIRKTGKPFNELMKQPISKWRM